MIKPTKHELKTKRIIINFNGVGYYYSFETGGQLTKIYSTPNKLKRYATINTFN